jgi:hypothetical protein
VASACKFKYITKFILLIQRYISILHRNTQFIRYSLAAAAFAWGVKQRFYMLSGDIERDLSLVTTAKIGAIHDPKFTAGALLERLESYRNSMRYNILSVRDSNTVARLEMAIDSLKTDVSDGSLRKQPFCVVLYGFPGTGKSSFAIQIARALMNDRYGSFNASDMVTLNETDQYQSEFRTSHKVVLFDDIGASKIGLADTQNPWRKVIDFVNNIKKTALNPNVEMKGRVFIEPDVVILTTNLDMASNSEIWSYIPAGEAIFRRFSVVYQVLSHTHVQHLNVTASRGSRSCVMSHEVDTLLDPYPISRGQAIETMRTLFKEHMDDQTKFIQYFNSYFDDLKVEEDIVVCESQSGPGYSPQMGDKESKDFMDDFRAKRYVYLEEYYYRFVKWDAYYANHGNFKPSYESIGIELNGFVTARRDRDDLIYIHPEPFNSALARWAEERDLLILDDRPPSYPTGLRAESKSKKKKAKQEKKEGSDFTLETHSSFDAWSFVKRLLGSNLLSCPTKQQFIEHNILSVLAVAKLQELKNKPITELLKWCWLVYLVELTRTQFDLEVAQIVKYLSKFAAPYFKDCPADKMCKKLIMFHAYAKKNGFIIGVGCDDLNLLRSLHFDEYLEEEEDSLTYSASEVYDLPDLDDCYITEPEDTFFDASDVDPSSTVDTFSTEAEWFDKIIKLIKTITPHSISSHTNVRIANFGEIDLILESDSSLLVIEHKSANGHLVKGLSQARRYSLVMSILRPNSRVVGLVHSPLGFKIACDLNPKCGDAFSTFLTMVKFLDR